MTTSNGVVTKGKMSWPTPVAVNDPSGFESIDGSSGRGHQIMPALTFAGGKLMLVYYGLFEDHTVGQLVCPEGEVCEDGIIEFVEERVPAGDLAEGNVDYVFDLQIADAIPPAYTAFLMRRHTIDVYAAQANPGLALNFGEAVRVSHYVFGTVPDYLEGSPLIEQLQFNPPNLPIFALGDAAFIGDYIDVASAPAFLPNADGTWSFNTEASDATVFHATWTDNRDVRHPPLGLSWSDYQPIPLVEDEEIQTVSKFDGSKLDPCVPGVHSPYSTAGMRNQNIYTSRLTQGLAVGALGNSKQLNIVRAFAVFVENTTDDIKGYLLTIVDDQPTTFGSFKQIDVSDPGNPTPLQVLAVKVAPRSSISRTVFVSSSDIRARVEVDVEELELDDLGDFVILFGEVVPVPGGLQGTVVLNPDITNPDITNPDITNPDITNIEVYNPDITNPDITNPDITNPDITNPDITNPDVTNIVVANPDITNPDITNPDITNPDITNPDITNPDITNPDITNGTLTDASWTVTNEGNTTATYNVNLLPNGTVPQGAKFQLIAHKTYETPVVQNCELKTETQNILVTNVASPDITNSDITNPDITNPDITNATVALAPGESVKVTMRVWKPKPNEATSTYTSTSTGDEETDPNFEFLKDFLGNHVSASVLSHGDGAVLVSLSISNEPLRDGVVGESYGAYNEDNYIEAIGGTGSLTWTPTGPLGGDACQGLSLNPNGSILEIAGSPVTTGICEFTVQVTDQADPSHTAAQTFAIQVRELSIAIGPNSATNVVGQPHTFVITVTADEGSGPVGVAGASPIVVIDPTPTEQPDDCDTDANGQCEVTMNSLTPGIFTANANVTVTYGTPSEEFDIYRDTAGNAGTNGSDHAEKEYIDPEGCSPGYWKNHLEQWGPSAGTDPDETFVFAFGVDFPGSPDETLLQAIQRNGGGYDKLARHGVAALLSARSPDVTFEFSVEQVIAMMQEDAGLEDDGTPGEPEASELAVANTRGCPLN